MLHTTRGIVLRVVKYRETSVVAAVFTELFGLQSYLVNGARSSKSNKANLLQPANMLELVVYHNAQKNLQRMAECRLAYIYRAVHFDVVRNMVTLYMVELLLHVLQQPEANAALYLFVESTLKALDTSPDIAANLPLYFTLKIGALSGFRLNGNYSAQTSYLDLQEGIFTSRTPAHPYYLDPALSEYSSRLMQAATPEEASQLPLNRHTRRQLLNAYMDYFALHLPDFKPMKSIAILHELLA
jgi:DNA repair protein RecO (recombination protein O)